MAVTRGKAKKAASTQSAVDKAIKAAKKAAQFADSKATNAKFHATKAQTDKDYGSKTLFAAGKGDSFASGTDKKGTAWSGVSTGKEGLAQAKQHLQSLMSEDKAGADKAWAKILKSKDPRTKLAVMVIKKHEEAKIIAELRKACKNQRDVNGDKTRHWVPKFKRRRPGQPPADKSKPVTVDPHCRSNKNRKSRQ